MKLVVDGRVSPALTPPEHEKRSDSSASTRMAATAAPAPAVALNVAPDASALVSPNEHSDMLRVALAYACHRDPLLTTARRMLDHREEAEDVVHDVFLKLQVKVMKKSEEVRFIAPFLLKSVLNRVADVLVDRKRWRSTFRALEDVRVAAERVPDAKDATTHLRGQEFTAVLARTGASMPPQRQEVFWLMFTEEGITVPEMSERLNITESTARYHVAEVRKTIEAMLHVEGYAHLIRKIFKRRKK